MHVPILYIQLYINSMKQFVVNGDCDSSMDNFFLELKGAKTGPH